MAEISAPGIVDEANAAGLAEGEPGWLDRAERRLPSTDAASRREPLGTDIRLSPISALNGASVPT
jgi:hypothetical protein